MVESYLGTKVELFICARNLLDKDVLSKSNPFCIVYMQAKLTGDYVEVGRTEIKTNNLNPNWNTTIIVDYLFETKQNMRFTVMDYDKECSEQLGEAFITLGEIIGRKGAKLLDMTGKGKLIIRAEEIKSIQDVLTFKLKGEHLDEKDWFGKSDPYLIIYRSLDSNTWTEIFKSEVIKDTTNPMWNQFTIPAQKLCNGDMKKPIKIECYDWDTIGSDELIGTAIVDLEHLSQHGWRFELQTPEKKLKGQNCGEIVVMDLIVKKYLSFIEYLQVGVQLNFSVAIDFTGSNGAYVDRNSLHHMNPQMPNQYEKAIWEIGSILEAYDTDKYFPIFGFGGIPRGERIANHCFPLTFDRSNPYVVGVQGLLDAYRKALPLVNLSGPTLFKNIIENVIAVAKSQPPHAAYHVLLILTDGDINDMSDTIVKIVEASQLPISIIIVGVGNDSFLSMQELDCDNGVLIDERGIKAARDIVQFVPFNKFNGNPVALAAEVLKEVPKQLTDFMSRIGYTPPIPEPISFESLYAQAALSQNAPVQSTPIASEQNVSIQNFPVNIATVQNAPVQVIPIQNVQNTPVFTAPVQDIPIQNVLVQNVPVQNATVFTPPVQVIPIQNVPVQNTHVFIAPVQDIPIQNVPMQNTPVFTTPVQDIPIQNVPVQNAPVQNVLLQKNDPFMNAPMQNAPVEIPPAFNAPVLNAPVEIPPVFNAPVLNTPIENFVMPQQGVSNLSQYAPPEAMPKFNIP
ncbi:hypothetical protein SteCoe_14706 [Stentor coeruleus]|uniref:C2 domain-containing protein n=1 Tax=Stentor coeruleus TaxID=5963 RepID=A0A1R2C5G3_9CILI|nr:hypothetical protein SteCoe_14706 [Stentor coeruleus]